MFTGTLYNFVSVIQMHSSCKSQKIIQYSPTPKTPELTREVNPGCRVIRTGDPAYGDLPLIRGTRGLLLVVLSETAALLQKLEQHQEKSIVSS